VVASRRPRCTQPRARGATRDRRFRRDTTQTWGGGDRPRPERRSSVRFRAGRAGETRAPGQGEDGNHGGSGINRKKCCAFSAELCCPVAALGRTEGKVE